MLSLFLITNLIIKTATKSLMGRQQMQHRCPKQRDDSHVCQEGWSRIAGDVITLPGAIGNLKLTSCLFLDLPFIIFRML